MYDIKRETNLYAFLFEVSTFMNEFLIIEDLSFIGLKYVTMQDSYHWEKLVTQKVTKMST